MNFSRQPRWSLFGLLVALWLPCTAFAQSETYPSRPVRIISGFGQGGPTDIVARVLADELTKVLKQQVYVENRPGASGNIATQALTQAPPDGYTYMIGATPIAVNRWLFPDFNVYLDKDFVAMSAIGASENALVVHPDLGVKTLDEFKALIRAKPDFITYATVGRGSSSHLAGVAFDLAAQTKMIAVPYRGGGEALQDLLGQHVNAWFATIPSVIEQVRAGQLVALATTGPARSKSFPDVPTMAERGFPDFDVRLWVGLFAHADVPEQRRKMVENIVEQLLATPQMTAVLETQGIAPMNLGGRSFSEFVRGETDRWRGVVEALDAKTKP
jgi:tripartite-type tricarboxylate transporter receptor subunit TctC